MWTFSLWTPAGSVLCVLLFCLTGSVSAAEPPAGSYVVKSFSYLSVLSVCGSYFRLCRAVDLHTVCRVVFILTERMHRSVQTDPSAAIKNRLRGYSPQSRAESRAERREERRASGTELKHAEVQSVKTWACSTTARFRPTGLVDSRGDPPVQQVCAAIKRH